MESARCPQPKIPSPTLSAASRGENKPLPLNEETLKTQETIDEVKPVLAPQPMLEKVRNTKVADVSEATHESMSVKEPASQGSAPLVEEEVQQRLASVEAGNVPVRFIIFPWLCWANKLFRCSFVCIQFSFLFCLLDL